MKKLMLYVTFLPVLAPCQQPAYVDPGMKAVVQVAIVCRDIDATSKRWAAVLGVDPPQIRTTKPGHEVKVMFRGHPSEGQAKLAFIKLGQVTLELIQPVGGNTSWKEFLDANGEGVQHIAFQVQDLDKTIQSLDGIGVPVLHQGRVHVRRAKSSLASRWNCCTPGRGRSIAPGSGSTVAGSTFNTH